MSKFAFVLLAASSSIVVAAPSQTPAPVTVKLANATGKAVGTATLTDTGSGVKIDLDLTGLPPGQHAIHFHEASKCEAPDFKTAGGHFNPDKAHHGANNTASPHPHAGDMPNITADAKGNVKTSLTDASVNLKAGDAHSLLAGGGTALVIHEKADDMKSDPAGNAGSRIACGVIAGG